MSSNLESDVNYAAEMLLICGYHRVFVCNDRFFPDDIALIITEYMREHIEWDTSLQTELLHISFDDRKDEEYVKKAILKFSNDNQSVETLNPFSTNYYCPSNYVLCRDTHKSVEWEVSMELMDKRSSPLFCIGYVEHPFVPERDTNDAWNYWLGNPPYNSTQFSVSVSGSSFCLRGGGKHGERIGGARSISISSGDMFGIHFDFIRMKTTFYHNGKLQGTMYNYFPSKVLPVMVICDSHKFTISKWKVIYK